MSLDELALARQAYTAYGETTGGKNFRGEPMPQFSDLPVQIQMAWLAAVDRVRSVLKERA